MEYLQNLGDIRQTLYCVYCGRTPETREHVPSRVFLDKPYPENLPTVGACQECNQKHSIDEEYLACLIECAKVGSVEQSVVRRDKVRYILSEKPALTERLRQAIILAESKIAFKVELGRIKSVLLKLAQGHLLFEQNEPPRENPISLNFGALESLTVEGRNFFENSSGLSLLPEVGSRSMQRMFISAGKVRVPWIEVQAGNYRYMTPAVSTVRIVISEYIWCQVEWI